MEKLINNAGRHGIYTLIDYHQDLMSEKFCGDGVPTWLATDLNLYRSFPTPLGKRIPLNDTGLPDWNNCDQNGWGKYYFSFDVGHAFA
jgi:endoglycosylceramidase